MCCFIDNDMLTIDGVNDCRSSENVCERHKFVFYEKIYSYFRLIVLQRKHCYREPRTCLIDFDFLADVDY